MNYKLPFLVDFVEFTDEEGYGKYLDLHEVYDKFLNLRGVEVSLHVNLLKWQIRKTVSLDLFFFSLSSSNNSVYIFSHFCSALTTLPTWKHLTGYLILPKKKRTQNTEGGLFINQLDTCFNYKTILSVVRSALR